MIALAGHKVQQITERYVFIYSEHLFCLKISVLRTTWKISACCYWARIAANSITFCFILFLMMSYYVISIISAS